MQPYIESIDTSLPLGRAVKDYGDIMFTKGFIRGLLTGVSLTLVISILMKRKV